MNQNVKGTLRQFVSVSKIDGLKGIQDNKSAANIDVLWVKGNTVEAAFEVESTTGFTEALRRGGALEKQTPKYMLIRRDEENLFQAKMKSPVFKNSFKQYNWKRIFFEDLSEAYKKGKKTVDLITLSNKRKSPPKKSTPKPDDPMLL